MEQKERVQMRNNQKRREHMKIEIMEWDENTE